MPSLPLVAFDCEVYPNYFLAAFKHLRSGEVETFEIVGSSRISLADSRSIKRLFKENEVFGFNSRNYDVPVLCYAIDQKRPVNTHAIYGVSSYIIKESQPGWMTMQHFGITAPKDFNHFDVQEPTPGVMISLKLYGGRMHSKRLQDLPIDPHKHLTPNERAEIKRYCINDLDTTIDLYNRIRDRIALRRKMAVTYDNPDLLSKSDAQIAEAVIKHDVKKLSRDANLKASPPNPQMRYQVPDFINFQTQVLQETLELIRSTIFKLNERGSVDLPKDIKSLRIAIGNSVYQMGIGGLHSTESKQSIIPTASQRLIDKDVTSYYPSIILNQQLYPKHLGDKFLTVYQDIVDKRIKAKREGDKITNESLKITINGSFGKFGNKWSSLYSPKLLLQTTLTGQLSLLMLIESLELNGISVISANTDGFVTLLEDHQYDLFNTLCFEWEVITSFHLEETEYKALYSRDVNNYLAVKTDSSTKGKGVFAYDNLMKSPQGDIIIIAVREYLLHQTPLCDTIKACNDIRQFITVRAVTGGGVWKDNYLGKVVRWVYATDGEGIYYKEKGNKVAKSDGALPVMELPDSLPDTLDYERYVQEAESVIASLGLTVNNQRE